jgi:hypothetical protein
MKNIAKTNLKKLYARNAVASIRIEGMSINVNLSKELVAYADGKKSIAQLIQATKERYVPV